MKKLFPILLLVLIATIANAQKNGSVIGTLIDSTNHKSVVSLATVSVYKLNDSAVTSFGLSDQKGQFKLTALPMDVGYKLVITAWRFKTYRKEILFNTPGQTLQLDSIYLSPKVESIDEVVISSERPPIIVRNDTIEFNAESFKTLPTAFVEDLFKKLPGFEVQGNGSVKVNGKSVSRILVDGREFFGGDQAIAMKQLPAFVVDKVQVADDVLAKRKDPDLDPALTPQIINLTLKKTAKKGLFGKIYAGNALEKFYEAGGILNAFRDTTQISILGYGNNINRTGFSFNDINKIGGFDRSGTRNYSIAADGSFSLDNMSFGGGGSGIQQSAGAGANFNTITHSGVKINGRYFYGQSISDIDNSVNSDQTFASSHLITQSRSLANNRFDYHNFGTKVEWDPNKKMSISLSSAISFSPVKYQSSNSTLTSDGANQFVNSAKTLSNRSADNAEYDFYGDLYKSFAKKGRSLSLSLYYAKTHKKDDFYNASKTLISAAPASSSSIDQLRKNALIILDAGIEANYSEPLLKSLSLSSRLTTDYLNNENGLLTFYNNPINNLYDLYVPSASETVVQSGLKATLRERIRWTVNKALSIQPGITVGYTSLMNTFINISPTPQNYTFLLPALNVRYNAISFDYSTSFNEPDISYIQPAVNNTDPLYIQNGNKNLSPTKYHNFSTRYSKYNPKKLMSLYITASWNIIENGIYMSRDIDGGGVQTVTPVNAEATWERRLGGGATKSYKIGKTKLLISPSLNLTAYKSFVDLNNLVSSVYNYSIVPRMGFSINVNDKIEFSDYYNLSINQSRYTGNFLDRRFLEQSHSFKLIIRAPKKVVFDTQLQYTETSQKFLDYKNTITLWNAGITYLFLKNDRAQLKFSANDILKSNFSRNTVITENMIRNSQSNALGRYMLLTLNYTIQSFGTSKNTGKNLLGF